MDEVYRIALAYSLAWQESRWDDLRALLAEEVTLESPGTPPIIGADEHVRLYAEGRRFAELCHVLPGPIANGPETALVAYDVYLGAARERRLSVCDQITVRERKVARLFSVVEEWRFSFDGN